MKRTVSVWLEGDEVSVPEWVNDLESFRRWTDDDDFPEHGRVAYLCGEVWIDLSKEQLFAHNRVKTICTTVLGGLVEAESSGLYFGDGAFLSNEEGDVSNQPDGTFISNRSLAENRVRMVEGKEDGLVEVEGSPDMVLEIVSRSSVRKDTVTLRAAYAAAGVGEYWLINARATPLTFDLLVLSKGAYRAAKKKAGWQFSPAFARWFRLVPFEQAGFASFKLEARAEWP
ncbi:MAG: Uma2 family endonuclease [Gemmataceae bacterium]